MSKPQGPERIWLTRDMTHGSLLPRWFDTLDDDFENIEYRRADTVVGRDIVRELVEAVRTLKTRDPAAIFLAWNKIWDIIEVLNVDDL